MAEKLVTNEFKTHTIRQVIESITEVANTLYYAFAGYHVPYPSGETTIPTISPSLEDVFIEPYRNMVFGKKITGSDMKLMVRRNDWTSNTIYTMYDHRDEEIYDKDYFIVVDAGSYHHVWKCLYNNNGGASTVQPEFGDAAQDANLFSSSDDYYATSDGYQWKYMYSVDDVTFEKFATEAYMPVVANNSVSSAAVSGAIDVILVEDGGRDYDNYISGTFTSSDITVGGDNLKYRLTSSANGQIGFYSNTFIYLTSGTGKGQYRKISNSAVSNTDVIVTLETQFETRPDSTTTYEISPEVRVTSDGTQSVNCEARALINSSSSNSVYGVEILNRGAGYSFATAEVLVGSAGVDTTAANVVPIISPRGGHGFDAAKELGARHMGISITFANNESGKISTDNDFRQFGIIKDPKFANVEVIHVKKSDGSPGSDGTFSSGETYYQINKKKIHGHATVSTGNTTLVANETDTEYADEFEVGDYIYITDTTNNYNFITTIAGTPNNDHLTLTASPSWSSAQTDVYYASIVATGTVGNTVDVAHFFSNDTEGKLVKNKLIIGSESFAVANVSGIDINDTYSNNETFDTFTQLTKFNGTSGTGSFVEDELVYQLNTAGTERVSTAYLHSAIVDGGTTSLYVTKVEGTFTTSKEIIGEDSGATMTLVNKYNGELETSTGDIIFLQNDVAVSRSNTQSETIRIILEY